MQKSNTTCPFCKEHKKRPLISYLRKRDIRKKNDSICEEAEEAEEQEEEHKHWFTLNIYHQLFVGQSLDWYSCGNIQLFNFLLVSWFYVLLFRLHNYFLHIWEGDFKTFVKNYYFEKNQIFKTLNWKKSSLPTTFKFFFVYIRHSLETFRCYKIHILTSFIVIHIFFGKEYLN